MTALRPGIVCCKFTCSCLAVILITGSVSYANDATILVNAASKAARMRVFHLPNGLLTTVAATPSSLRESATYRISLNRTTSPSEFRGLEAALGQTLIEQNARYVDVRWGCDLYSKQGRLLASFFVDGGRIMGLPRSRYAVLNGRKIVINDSLWRSFESNFPSAE